MRTINRITLLGNVVADPEKREFQGSKSLTRFRLATNRQFKTADGRPVKETEFHQIVAWSKLGELCMKYLTKGMPVLLEGRLANRSWQGKDGLTHRSAEIVLDQLNILKFSRDKEVAAMPSQALQ